MKMLIVDRYYLNMVPNKSAESNILTSADCSDNVKKFFSGGEWNILNEEESKLERHERICKAFDFQMNEIEQICRPVLFKNVPVQC